MISKLLDSAKENTVAEHDRLYITYQKGKYTIFVDNRLVLQVNGRITYNLYNKYVARIAKDALAILKPEAKVVYPHIMIGELVC